MSRLSCASRSRAPWRSSRRPSPSPSSFTSDHDTNPWLVAGFAATAGLSFVLAGLVALWRRPENTTGYLLAATGYLWFIAALTEADNPWVWVIGFVLGNLALVCFAALILAYPDGTLSRRDVSLVASADSRRSSRTRSPLSSAKARDGCDAARRARSRSPTARARATGDR